MPLRPGLSRVANRTIAALEKIRDSKEATPSEKLEAITMLVRMIGTGEPEKQPGSGKRRGRPPKNRPLLAMPDYVPNKVDQSLKDLIKQEKQNNVDANQQLERTSPDQKQKQQEVKGSIADPLGSSAAG